MQFCNPGPALEAGLAIPLAMTYSSCILLGKLGMSPSAAATCQDKACGTGDYSAGDEEWRLKHSLPSKWGTSYLQSLSNHQKEQVQWEWLQSHPLLLLHMHKKLESTILNYFVLRLPYSHHASDQYVTAQKQKSPTVLHRCQGV